MDNETNVSPNDVSENEKEYIKRQLEIAQGRTQWTPTQFALFILTVDYEHFLDTPLEIKKRFKLKISIEKIEKMMKSKEYNEVILRWFLQYAKSDARTAKQFYLIKERYFKQQMKTNVGRQAVDFFGMISDKFNPRPNSQITNLINLTPEQNEQLGKSVLTALKNREARLKETKEGGADGKN